MATNLEWLYQNNAAVRTAVNAFASEEHIERYDGELFNWLMSERCDADGELDELEMLRAERNKWKAEDIKYTRNRFSELEKAKNERIAKLEAERDELKKRVDEQQETLDVDCCDLIEYDNEICKLTAERDELKRKLEILKAHGVEIVDAVAGGFEVYNEAIRERDEWKAKVKTLADYSRYWRGRCAKLEYRSDKRAAAVERLRKMQYVDDYGDWVEAIAEVVKGTDKSNIGDCGMWESLIDLLTDDNAHSKAQSITESNLTEQSESLSDESDSREKLEADVHIRCDGGMRRKVLEWLDRQAAIVEREWQESNDRLIDTMRTTSEQYREKIAELQAKVDELNAELESEPNPDGLPVGLTISDDGALLNWRGENYVRQGASESGTCHSTTDGSAWCFACSECGKTFPRNNLHLACNHGEINYCPNCGRKVMK